MRSESYHFQEMLQRAGLGIGIVKCDLLLLPTTGKPSRPEIAVYRYTRCRTYNTGNYCSLHRDDSEVVLSGQR